MTETPSLIDLSGVTKVFLTDEVETHALAGIHLKIEKGESPMKRSGKDGITSARFRLAPDMKYQTA